MDSMFASQERLQMDHWDRRKEAYERDCQLSAQLPYFLKFTSLGNRANLVKYGKARFQTRS